MDSDPRDEAGGAGQDGDGRFKIVEANQIVAYNLSYYRRKAGLTQEELGERIGWSKVVVSSAERSWHSNRPRQFTANDLVALSDALGIPLQAFLLPPPDDGHGSTYLLTQDGGDLSMADLMQAVVTDPGQDTPVLDAYRTRYVAATRRYGGTDFGDQVAEAMREATDLEMLIDRRDMLANRQADLANFHSEMGQIVEAIDRVIDAQVKKQEDLDPEVTKAAKVAKFGDEE